MIQPRGSTFKKAALPALVIAVGIVAVILYQIRSTPLSALTPSPTLLTQPNDEDLQSQSTVAHDLSSALENDQIYVKELSDLQRTSLVEQTSTILSTHLHGDLADYIALMSKWGGVLDDQVDQKILSKVWPEKGKKHQIISIDARGASLRRPEWTVRNGVRGLLMHGAGNQLGILGPSLFHFSSVADEDLYDDSLLGLNTTVHTLSGRDKHVTFWVHWSKKTGRWIPVQTTEDSPNDVHLPRLVF